MPRFYPHVKEKFYGKERCVGVEKDDILIGRKGRTSWPYVIEINFEAASQIPGEDPRYYLDPPTSFKLSKEQVAELVAIGPKLLEGSPQYQCLPKALAAEAEGQPHPRCPVGAGIFP